jgi:hypothetical protein
MIMTAAGDQNNLYGVLCLPEGHAGSETAARSVESQVAEWEGSLSLPTSSSEVRVVASVPDGWFRDHHGAERRERMVSAARRGRFTVVDVVPTSATVAAAWASASAVMEGLELVVLLLGHREVETSVWRWEGTGLHPVERLWHEVLGGMDLLARIQRLLNNRGVRTSGISWHTFWMPAHKGSRSPGWQRAAIPPSRRHPSSVSRADRRNSGCPPGNWTGRSTQWRLI